MLTDANVILKDKHELCLY